MAEEGSTLTMALPRGFDLPRTVCSYGYFVLAPNHWVVHKRQLARPLRDAGGRVVWVGISQRQNQRTKLTIQCHRKVGRADHATLKQQITYMLRLDEDVRPWLSLHAEAKARRFARMFRSPTLWEDMVKTITSCNVGWRSTMAMNRLMCQHVGSGGFPTPAEIADYGSARLKANCQVGYRAERIVRLARGVLDGSIDLAWFQDAAHDDPQVYDALKAIYGIGDYAASNLMQLLGRYDHLPIDTETYRHFEQVYGVKRPKTHVGYARLHKRIEKHYQPFKPYRFKAYWFELWRFYESRYGDAWKWDREQTAPNFTAVVLK